MSLLLTVGTSWVALLLTLVALAATMPTPPGPDGPRGKAGALAIWTILGAGAAIAVMLAPDVWPAWLALGAWYLTSAILLVQGLRRTRTRERRPATDDAGPVLW